VKKNTRAASERVSPRTRRGREEFPAPGRQTRDEVLSQPVTWRETLRQIRSGGSLTQLTETFDVHAPWLFVGCGSSYYLSQLVASLWTRQLRIPCEATTASELLFAPEETLWKSRARQAVLVSRSGETTEVLRAAQLLRRRGSIRTLGITCNTAGPLEKLCTQVLTLDWADEKSTVMTRSFTSMLVLLQHFAAKWSGDETLCAELESLPEKGQRWLRSNADKIRSFSAGRQFADFVFLGHGAHYWLAQEAALKVTEMSSSYAQAYHSLEFRHGPRAIAGRETLITFLLSDAAREQETLLVRELKKFSAPTMVVANRKVPALAKSCDLLLELGLDGPEAARLAVTALPAQLLGLEIGLRKKLNPDAPKNLTRAVVLAPAGSRSTKVDN
jgi:glutamine---fructose-6-phosphate transaminase (isomerizing)